MKSYSVGGHQDWLPWHGQGRIIRNICRIRDIEKARLQDGPSSLNRRTSDICMEVISGPFPFPSRDT